MKKVLIAVALLLMLGVNNSNSFSQVIRRNGNTFTVAKVKQVSKSATKTKFTWQDSKGNLYPIYVSQSGATYVLRTSKKSGKEYKSYLGEEISKAVCKELGIEYKSSKRK